MTVVLLAFFLSQDASDLIEKLRSDRVEERDEAERKLRELGRPALPALKKAETDPDAEVAARALHLGRVIRGTDRLTPNFYKAFPKLEEKLGSDNDNEWTEAFFKATCLEPEDLDPLAARDTSL